MRISDRRRLVCGCFALLGFLAVPSASAWSQSAAPTQAPPENAEMQELIRRLNGITDDAARTHAARPNVIKALRDLAASYDRPWHTVILRDDFRDGDFT